MRSFSSLFWVLNYTPLCWLLIATIRFKTSACLVRHLKQDFNYDSHISLMPLNLQNNFQIYKAFYPVAMLDVWLLAAQK